ncbi:MAG: RloB family protein [Peptostreptococcaceae bacterium]|nr:RloB family protein [Peptostreptococcaceae bacterium]
MGTRLYSGWDKRTSDDQREIEPCRKYIFVCEGVNTEVYYFKKLIDLRKELGIHPLIDITVLDRTDEDRSNSYPKQLFEYARQCKADEHRFDKDYDDKIIVVFDADIFEFRSDQYGDIVKKGEEESFVLGVTNPCFEIFLLLYFENSYKELIEPDLTEFLKPENLKSKGLAYRKLFEKTKINSKTNEKIGDLAEYVKIAIEEEKFLNQDIHCCKGNITSNIGKIIEAILSEKVEQNG